MTTSPPLPVRDPAPAPPLGYRIDRHDRITTVNEAFVDEAAGDGPRAAVRDGLLGRVLWAVLPDAADWYAPLVRRARDEQRRIAFNIRCDTPDLRRLMRMCITPSIDGSVCFESALVGVQARPRVDLLDPDRTFGSRLVVMCSWCKRVEVGQDWLEVEDALERLRVFDEAELPTVSHGICPRCVEELTALASGTGATLSIDLPPRRPDGRP